MECLGDLFACHAVDNPSCESEISMLRRYGPDVPGQTLRKLVEAFGELRDLADEETLNYPYSTRECVNIVKHLQEFSNEPLPTVVRNVFDFDTFTAGTKDTVVGVSGKHGIPVGDKRPSGSTVKLGIKFPMPEVSELGMWAVKEGDKRTILELETSPLRFQGPYPYNPETYHLSRFDMRTELFSEQTASWQVPLPDSNLVADVTANDNGEIFVGTVNPLCVYQINPAGKYSTAVELYKFFPTATTSHYRPRLKLAALDMELFPGCVLVHEEMTNKMLLLDIRSRHIHIVDSSPVGKLMRSITSAVKGLDKGPVHFRMLPQLAGINGCVFVYQRNGCVVNKLDFISGSKQTFSVPNGVRIENCLAVDKNTLLIQTENGCHLLSLLEGNSEVEVKLSETNFDIGKGINLKLRDNFILVNFI